MKRIASSLVLAVVYSTTALLAKITAKRRKRGDPIRRGILVIGTFHNPNWVVAHIIPLRDAGIGDLTVVADNELNVDGIAVLVPPRWLSRAISRAGAKFFVALRAAIRTKPSLIVGFHIFPAAVSAVTIGSIVGSPSCYQVTSGSLELDGGGWHSENVILKALGRSNKLIHSLVISIVKQFELIVVRGSGAESFLRANSVTTHIVRITGSVEFPSEIPGLTERAVDVLFVGRLTEYKRPDRFVAVMSELFKDRPQIKVVLIGDGPDRAELEQEVEKQKMTEAVTFMGQQSNVIDWHQKGVSIALLEAMACGAVPVVSDVGDMKDFVRNGETGYILPEDDIEAFATRIQQLLSDESKWHVQSENCRNIAENNVTCQKIAEKWAAALELIETGATKC